MCFKKKKRPKTDVNTNNIAKIHLKRRIEKLFHRERKCSGLYVKLEYSDFKALF